MGSDHGECGLVATPAGRALYAIIVFDELPLLTIGTSPHDLLVLTIKKPKPEKGLLGLLHRGRNSVAERRWSLCRCPHLKLITHDFRPGVVESSRPGHRKATHGVGRLDEVGCLAHSFDHLVGGADKGWRQVEAKRPGGLQVDDEMKFGRCLHRQVGRLFALEDAIDISCRAPVLVDKIRPIRDQSDGRAARWATICSLVTTAKLNNVEPFAYLRDVLERLSIAIR
jgi:hypothetical protein